MSERLEKSAYELAVGDEFLKHLGMPVSNLWNVQHNRGPDLEFDLQGERHLHIGLELTDYYSDGNDGFGSPSRRREGVWDAVWRRLEEKHFVANPLLAFLDVSVSYEESNEPLPKNQANAVADELVEFISASSINLAVGESAVYRSRPTASSPASFREMSLLHRFVSRIWVHRSPVKISRWSLGSAAHVGLDGGQVCEMITGKAKRRVNYLAEFDQVWLLLVASGANAYARIVGDPSSQEAFHSDEVQSATTGAGFDRVIFWERVADWHVCLYDEVEFCLAKKECAK